MSIRVQAQAFDPGQELNALHAANLGIGAVVSFVGYVRDFNEGREVGGMFLEHFPGRTEKALGKIAAEAAFDACNFIMDYLKTRAPFWKKEDTAEGPRWVEGRCSDQDAAARWQKS